MCVYCTGTGANVASFLHGGGPYSMSSYHKDYNDTLTSGWNSGILNERSHASCSNKLVSNKQLIVSLTGFHLLYFHGAACRIQRIA